MSFLLRDSVNIARNPPISTVTVNKNTVAFINANGKQKVELNSSLEKTKFIKWLLR